MFGIGIGEVIVILVIALIVIGPKQMPEAARLLGATIRKGRSIWREVQDTLNDEDDHKK